MRGRELRVDRRRLVRGLPAGARRGMVAPDPVADVREQRVLRIGLDVRALRLSPLEMEEAQEVLEVARAQNQHTSGDERDDRARDGEVASLETSPARDCVQQSRSTGPGSDQPGGCTGEDQAHDAARDADPSRRPPCEQDGGEPDREREGRERCEVRMAEEGRLAPAGGPGVSDVDAEDLQQPEKRGDDAPRDDHRGDELPLVATAQDQGQRDGEQRVLRELRRRDRMRERLRPRKDPDQKRGGREPERQRRTQSRETMP